LRDNKEFFAAIFVGKATEDGTGDELEERVTSREITDGGGGG